MKKTLRLISILCLPVALLALATTHFYEARFNIDQLFANKGGPLTIAAILAGLYCLGLLIYVSYLKERLARSVGEREKILKIGDFYAEKSESMQGDLEVLSAVRNLTSILADEMQLDAILSQVTQVVAEVTECTQVTIFMIDEATRLPIPRAHRVGDTCVTGDDLRSVSIGDTNVADAIEHQTIMRMLDAEDQVTLAVPLSADQELLGALQLVAPITGEVSQKSERMERIESMSMSLAKHVSIAIKTPILYNRAVVDGLTGLYTRRHFARQIETQFSASLRLSRPMSLILLDLDNFKSHNDTHGHLFGDRVLTTTGQLILNSLRGYDTAYRYGGEEICVILPEADADAAFKVAERIRQKLARKVLRTQQRARVTVTLSAGVAEFETGMKAYVDLIARADEALYAAKGRGKNRTCIWEKTLHDNLPADTRRAPESESKPAPPRAPDPS